MGAWAAWLGTLAVARSDLAPAPLAASPLDVEETLKTWDRTRAVARRKGRVLPVAALVARTPVWSRERP